MINVNIFLYDVTDISAREINIAKCCNKQLCIELMFM